MRKWCQVCTKDFHLLRRRHHCRGCGEVYCNDCAPVHTQLKLRLCADCEAHSVYSEHRIGCASSGEHEQEET